MSTHNTRPKMFDAATAQGLMAIQGWPFHYRGQKWIVHQVIGVLRKWHTVSHEELGFSVSQSGCEKSRAATVRNFKQFMEKVSDEKLAAAMEKARKERPAHRVAAS